VRTKVLRDRAAMHNGLFPIILLGKHASDTSLKGALQYAKRTRSSSALD
jgi:hypothetical protein